MGVIEEGRRPYVVTIPADEAKGGSGGGGGSSVILTVPMDPRIPKIRIKTRQLAQVRSFPSIHPSMHIYTFSSGYVLSSIQCRIRSAPYAYGGAGICVDVRAGRLSKSTKLA